MSEYRKPDSFKNLPQHVAIIMDGNGRWARRQAWKRILGHNRGVETVRLVTEAASALNLKQLTLYALSTENWSFRPRREVEFLMNLLKTFVVKEQKTMMENNIRFTTIGHVEEFPQEVQEAVHETLEMTAKNTGLCLCLALNYGGRREILDATTKIAHLFKQNKIDAKDINEKLIQESLYQPQMPELDLLIRTAGEMRVSNFLLWQISYSEIWVTQKLWPEFTQEDLYQALEAYADRERRYGGLLDLNKASS